jgi:hypothetical protein
VLRWSGDRAEPANDHRHRERACERVDRGGSDHHRCCRPRLHVGRRSGGSTLAAAGSLQRRRGRSPWPPDRRAFCCGCRWRSTTRARGRLLSATSAAASQIWRTRHRSRDTRLAKTLRPLPDDFDDFPTPFPIEGRQALSLPLQFGDESAPIKLGTGTHRVLVEVDTSVSGEPSWRNLVDFDLHVHARAPTRELHRAPERPRRRLRRGLSRTGSAGDA